MVVAFNATTHPPLKDETCPVDQTDDARLPDGQSWMVFRPCEEMIERRLDEEVRRGTLRVSRVSAEFLLKIQQGALRSTHTLGRHLKTGQWSTGQSRPMAAARMS